MKLTILIASLLIFLTGCHTMHMPKFRTNDEQVEGSHHCNIERNIYCNANTYHD